MLSAQKRDVWKLILLFFVPAMFVWLTTMVIPFLYGIFISFLQWDGIGNNYEFIGLENYIKIFSTPRFMETLGRTAVYTIGTVVLSNILGIALGLLLTSALKGRNLFRTAIFVPAVCILEFGGTDGVTYGQVGGECNALQSGLSLFSGDQNDAISCLRTIKRGGRRTFQDVDAFYVVRIQVGNPVTGITVQSIVVTADYGGGGFC